MKKMLVSVNPATGKIEGEYEQISYSEIQGKIKKSYAVYNEWKHFSFEKRANYFNNLANVLDSNKEKYAQMITNEMGKVIVQSRKEIEKCAWVCRYYADNTSYFLQDELVKTEAYKSFVTFQPMGVILAIMPWNFPFYQVIRFAAPAIMSGNTGILKHASNVQGAASMIEDAFLLAGFPEGVFTNLCTDTSAIKQVIEHKHIVAVTLTGSEKAGREVASIAGYNLKKTVMELGGSDAYIILNDADLEEAADLATKGRLQNAGQTCIASKRIVVLDKVYKEFLEKYKKSMAKEKMGDPMKEDSFYGPMSKEDLRNELHEQVKKSINQGASLILGGEIPKCQGYYYPATILSDVKPGMEAFDNELFGPVASVIKAENEKEAIALANNTSFGLGSGVITSNKEKGEKIALELEAGNSFVNSLVVSDPRMPFGGIKNSGYGRELSGYGIREFVNIKSISIK